ncbi:MAG: site-2 protease family protein [Bdellovibrionota bacterium]
MANWTLFHVRGVPIRIHFTLLLAIPYFALVIASQIGPMASLASIDSRLMRLPALVWGLLLSLGLFACVALHELAHSLWALRAGRKVRSITLMLLGGVSDIDGEGHSEASIAFLGPLVSFALGFFFYSLYQNTMVSADLGFGFFYLAQLNLTIAVFNLLPAFPLDGGRLLRALLAKRMTAERATQIAVTLGKAFAVAFGVFGVLTFNLILILIALFVYAGGTQELQVMRMRNALRDARAEEFMVPLNRSIAAATTIDQVLSDLLHRKDLWVAVTHSSGKFLGVAELRTLLTIPKERRSSIPVGMLTRHEMPHLKREDSGSKVLEEMLRDGPYVAIVNGDGVLEGVIDRDSLAQAIRLRQITTDDRQAA